MGKFRIIFDGESSQEQPVYALKCGDNVVIRDVTPEDFEELHVLILKCGFITNKQLMHKGKYIYKESDEVTRVIINEEACA